MSLLSPAGRRRSRAKNMNMYMDSQALTGLLMRGNVEKHQLFEELEACHPRYQQQFPTLRAAAAHCGVTELFNDYLRTQQGARYRDQVTTVPDVLGATRAMQESADRLPYKLDNIGLTAATGE
jgi:hypothetical protein